MSRAVETKGRGTGPAEEFVWSAASVARLLRCGRQFRYADVERLTPQETASAAFTAELRGCAFRAHTRQIETGDFPGMRELLDDFTRRWEEALERSPAFPAKGPGPGTCLLRGHQALRAFHEAARLAPTPLAVRVPFRLEIQIEARSGTTFVLLRDSVDRIDELRTADGKEAVGVAAYRCGRVPRGDPAEDLHLTVSRMGAQRLTGQTVVRMAVFQINKGKEKELPREVDNTAWFRDRILPFACSSLEAGRFPPMPGGCCRTCGFRERCLDEGLPQGTQALPGSDGYE